MTALFHQAADSYQFLWASAAMTALFVAVFLGWTAWAFWPSRKQAMEEAARMPLDDGGEA